MPALFAVSTCSQSLSHNYTAAGDSAPSSQYFWNVTRLNLLNLFGTTEGSLLPASSDRSSLGPAKRPAIHWRQHLLRKQHLAIRYC